MADRETLDVYRERAGDYAKRFASEGKIGRHLQAFLDEVPKGGRVLDLGCGPGDALAGMVSSGFAAEGLDASPEFAEMARMRSGANVRLAEFADLDDVEAFDGIYANFSLLHAPKSDMPDHLRQIASALKPGGIFHLGTKTGDGERRDGLGRAPMLAKATR